MVKTQNPVKRNTHSGSGNHSIRKSAKMARKRFSCIYPTQILLFHYGISLYLPAAINNKLESFIFRKISYFRSFKLGTKVCVGLRRVKTSQAGRVLFHQFYSKRDR